MNLPEMDPMDLDDHEFQLWQARKHVAAVYRREGFEAFARPVELGQQDSCSQMRVTRFFIDPPRPHDAAFIAAWKQASSCRESK